MTVDLRVLGIDPGPVPGIVLLSYAEHRLVKAEAVQCSASLAPAIIAELLTLNNTDTLVQTEQFVIGRRAARSSTASAGAETREVIGEIRARWPFTVLRTAGQVKPWATDLRLEAAGLLEATKGMRHAKDAARHALFCAVHDAGVPDPLSRKAERA